MTLSREWTTPEIAAGGAATVSLRGRVGLWLVRPLGLLIVLSALFGTAIMAINPPLRGADEAAHFLRAYAIARGEIVPAARDDKGRRGLLLPARIYEDFELFENARYRLEEPGFSYGEVFRDYRQRRATPAPLRDARRSTFVVYQGSEVYTPVAYLPYAAAGVAARALALDFVETLFLMRLVGLIATTAIVAYAIALAPQLAWPFFMIAMLPMAIYSRAVMSADGVVLGCTMVGIALCLRGAQRRPERPAWEHAAWMTYAILTKPPQAAFVLIEAMRRPWRELPRQWGRLLLIALPGVALTVGWMIAISGDAGTWRVIEGTGEPADEFGIARKLAFMLDHPLHFFTSMIATLDKAPEFWRQTLGVLGWADVDLRPFVYPLLTAMLPLTFLQPLTLDEAARRRVAFAALAGALAYVVAIFLVFYLTWTPVEEPKVWGIQGRYFIVMLPAVAVAVAALVRRGLNARAVAAIAVAGALISGVACLEALLRVHW